jgi:hypothetical protein
MQLTPTKVGMIAAGIGAIVGGVATAADAKEAATTGRGSGFSPAGIAGIAAGAGLFAGTMAWCAAMPMTQGAAVGLGLGGAFGALMGGSLYRLSA